MTSLVNFPPLRKQIHLNNLHAERAFSGGILKVATREGLDLLKRGVNLAWMANFHVGSVENIK